VLWPFCGHPFCTVNTNHNCALTFLWARDLQRCWNFCWQYHSTFQEEQLWSLCKKPSELKLWNLHKNPSELELWMKLARESKWTRTMNEACTTSWVKYQIVPKSLEQCFFSFLLLQKYDIWILFQTSWCWAGCWLEWVGDFGYMMLLEVSFSERLRRNGV